MDTNLLTAMSGVLGSLVGGVRDRRHDLGFGEACRDEFAGLSAKL